MEMKYAKFFIDLVQELIKDNEGREKLFDALKGYQSSQDLPRFLEDMREILDEPNKLELFNCMRPLVLLHHQMEYSQLMPSVPGVKARIVRLRRRPGEGLGFAVRGGLEHGVGIFVTDVKAGSQADRQGLVVGDEIVKVNGFSISEAIHDEVLSLIKSKDDIELKVTHIGMFPVKQDPRSDVKWKYADKGLQDCVIGSGQESKAPKDLKIFIDSTGHHSLGCGIVSGPQHLPGIFVESVRPGSLAEEVNLEPGDQIVEVNGTQFQRTSHKEAVLALVSSRLLHITIRKKVGTKLMDQIPDLKPTIKKELSTNQIQAKDANSTNRNAQNSNLSPQSSTENENESRSPSKVTKEVGGINDWMLDIPVKTKAEVHSSLSSSSSSSLSSLPEVRYQAKGIYPNDTSDTNSNTELREEIKNRLGSSSQSSPLSGAAAIMEQRRLQNSNQADLLGCGEGFEYNDTVSNKIYNLFGSAELDGRPLHSLMYKKDMDLGVSLEGGLGSPLNGKILVAMVFDDGVAKKCGKMHVGDQLMAVNGTKLVDVTVTKANCIIEDAALTSQDTIELVFCESTLVNEEECMTYF